MFAWLDGDDAFRRIARVPAAFHAPLAKRTCFKSRCKDQSVNCNQTHIMTDNRNEGVQEGR